MENIIMFIMGFLIILLIYFSYLLYYRNNKVTIFLFSLTTLVGIVNRRKIQETSEKMTKFIHDPSTLLISPEKVSEKITEEYKKVDEMVDKGWRIIKGINQSYLFYNIFAPLKISKYFGEEYIEEFNKISREEFEEELNKSIKKYNIE